MAVRTGCDLSIPTLTARRRRIALLASRRWTAAEIGRELGLSIRTVQRHQAGHRTGRRIGK